MPHDTEKFTVRQMMTDLYMSYYGHEQCTAGQRYGPAVRDHHLYVFIVRGKGIYKVKGQEYPLKQGQAFILFPHEPTQYEADLQEPWEYMWFGFGGNQARDCLLRSGIHVGEPVLTHKHPERMHRWFNELLAYEPQNVPADELFYTGSLSSMLFEICCQRARKHLDDHREREKYAELARDFMGQHYDKDIQIRDVARYVGLERSYFTKLFKLETGASPYQYVMGLRFTKGKQLLLETEMPVEHIALLLGFKDTFHFSAFFKKKAGCSPLSFRKQAADTCSS